MRPTTTQTVNGPTRLPVVDVIYVAACDIDARFTRICIASIRKFYPRIPVRLLAGAPLQRGLANELEKYWNVGIENIPAGEYSWGYVKLEALFGKPGERFLMLDSDTVMTGPVLNILKECDAPFVVDNGKLSYFSDGNMTDVEMKLLYYDWDKLREAGHGISRPEFVFNSGQWFGTAGIVSRDDFAPWLEWTMPRRPRHKDFFKLGDQAILNFVLHRKIALDGLRVDQRQIMRWPAHSLAGVDAISVAKQTAEALIVHWAGIKKLRQRDMLGSDLLAYFEKSYYEQLPFGSIRRWYDIWRD